MRISLGNPWLLKVNTILLQRCESKDGGSVFLADASQNFDPLFLESLFVSHLSLFLVHGNVILPLRNDTLLK